MGAPKLKWTSEEEAALKAGIARYGAGKWSTILKDEQFHAVLHSRSNVDLKDKWRNMNVAANGLGSRSKARVSVRNNQQIVKDDQVRNNQQIVKHDLVRNNQQIVKDDQLRNNQQIVKHDQVRNNQQIVKDDHDAMAISTVVLGDQEILDATPLSISDGILGDGCPKKTMLRLDNIIFEAITNLKEPRGSSRAAIGNYIEEQYSVPEHLDRLLVSALKRLIEDGKLMKVKHLYRILPKSATTNMQKDPAPLLLEGIQSGAPIIENNKFKIVTKSGVDEFLENMKNMTPEEAAAAAAQAVAEAEAAIAEATEAAMEAEQAEAEAEAARAFNEAAVQAMMRAYVHW